MNFYSCISSTMLTIIWSWLSFQSLVCEIRLHHMKALR